MLKLIVLLELTLVCVVDFPFVVVTIGVEEVDEDISEFDWVEEEVIDIELVWIVEFVEIDVKPVVRVFTGIELVCMAVVVNKEVEGKLVVGGVACIEVVWMDVVVKRGVDRRLFVGGVACIELVDMVVVVERVVGKLVVRVVNGIELVDLLKVVKTKNMH